MAILLIILGLCLIFRPWLVAEAREREANESWAILAQRYGLRYVARHWEYQKLKGVHRGRPLIIERIPNRKRTHDIVPATLGIEEHYLADSGRSVLGFATRITIDIKDKTRGSLIIHRNSRLSKALNLMFPVDDHILGDRNFDHHFALWESRPYDFAPIMLDDKTLRKKLIEHVDVPGAQIQVDYRSFRYEQDGLEPDINRLMNLIDALMDIADMVEEHRAIL